MMSLRLSSCAALVALLLAGCASTPPPPPAWRDLTPPDADTLAPAPALADIPACDRGARRERIACRAIYDADTRAKYVALAGRHAAVAGWVRIVIARQRTP
jgi:hypothetical protein